MSGEVGKGDSGADIAIGVEQWFAERAEAEAAAAFPANRFVDCSVVCSGYHVTKARNNVSIRMLSHFNRNMFSSNLVRDHCRSPRTSK